MSPVLQGRVGGENPIPKCKLPHAPGNNHLKEGHMTNIHIHIGEMLARNGRMYPNDIALIERIPAEKKSATIT
jgi:hypothetical protein